MASTTPSTGNTFIVQFDGGIVLTDAQRDAIEEAIQATLAEQVALLSLPVAIEPLQKLEGLPFDPDDPSRRTSGAIGRLKDLAPEI